MDALCPGNVLFGHAENEMSINPFCLFVRQTGNRRMKLLHGDFPLIQFMGRYGNKDSFMLQPVIPIKGIVGFVAVCTQPISSLFTIKLFEHFCNFFRYFHEAI